MLAGGDGRAAGAAAAEAKPRADSAPAASAAAAASDAKDYSVAEELRCNSQPSSYDGRNFLKGWTADSVAAVRAFLERFHMDGRDFCKGKVTADWLKMEDRETWKGYRGKRFVEMYRDEVHLSAEKKRRRDDLGYLD